MKSGKRQDARAYSRERLMYGLSFHTKYGRTHLPRENRIDKLNEDLLFERCQLLLGQVIIPAWIARTSRNFHGAHVLEIMAEERLRQRYDLKR